MLGGWVRLGAQQNVSQIGLEGVDTAKPLTLFGTVKECVHKNHLLCAHEPTRLWV